MKDTMDLLNNEEKDQSNVDKVPGSILIKDTTKEQRERIVAESLGEINGSCDGCMAGLAEMYQDYIDGKKEIREINMEFNAHYTSGMEVPERQSCEYFR